MSADVHAPPEIVYPSSDGKPMADNTLQALWIATLWGNLEALFAARPDVFVAMNNLWYPVQGMPKRRVAPDVYVAFGRPKGHRGSYMQWVEGGVPLTVVFEILSPGNKAVEMARKFAFYQLYGVSEYVVLDPDRCTLDAWERVGAKLRFVKHTGTWTSPRLGVRFEIDKGVEIRAYNPDGSRMLSFAEFVAAAEQGAAAATARVAAARLQAAAAVKKAAATEKKAAATEARVAALAAKLRALGVDPDAE